MTDRRVDWSALAGELGALPTPARVAEQGLVLGDGALPTSLHVTVSGGEAARDALSLILGDQVWRDAVGDYVDGAPHAELVRSVMILLRPRPAAAECLRIYRQDRSERRRVDAIELLRSIARPEQLSVLTELMGDPDPQVRAWGARMVQELLYTDLAAEDVEPVVRELLEHPSPVVRRSGVDLLELVRDWSGEDTDADADEDTDADG